MQGSSPSSSTLSWIRVGHMDLIIPFNAIVHYTCKLWKFKSFRIASIHVLLGLPLSLFCTLKIPRHHHHYYHYHPLDPKELRSGLHELSFHFILSQTISIQSSNCSMSFLIVSIHVLLGLPRPLLIQWQNCMVYLFTTAFGGRLCTCPNQRNPEQHPE